jgi:hypothetical protein
MKTNKNDCVRSSRERLDDLTRRAIEESRGFAGGQGRTGADLEAEGDGVLFGAVWIALVGLCLLVWWLIATAVTS